MIFQLLLLICSRRFNVGLTLSRRRPASLRYLLQASVYHDCWRWWWWWFLALEAARIIFVQNLRFALPPGFLLCKLAWSFRKGQGWKHFAVVFLKGLKFSGGMGWSVRGEEQICVCVLFFLSSTQWSFQRTSLKRHSYSLCAKGVSAGRVCWCRQAGWWLTKVIRLWNLAGEWGGVSSAPSRRALQGQGRRGGLPPASPPSPPSGRLSCVLPLVCRTAWTSVLML